MKGPLRMHMEKKDRFVDLCNVTPSNTIFVMCSLLGQTVTALIVSESFTNLGGNPHSKPQFYHLQPEEIFFQYQSRRPI